MTITPSVVASRSARELVALLMLGLSFGYGDGSDSQRTRHPLTGGGGGDGAQSAVVNAADPANCLASWASSRSPVGKDDLATCRRRAGRASGLREATGTVLAKRLPLSTSCVPIRATCPKTVTSPAYTRRR